MDIEKIGKHLQKILHIEDWNIEYILVGKEDINGNLNKGELGSATIQPYENKAKICILDYNVDDYGIITQYEVLIHELIHVLLFRYDDFADDIVEDNIKGKFKIHLKKSLVQYKEINTNNLARIIMELHPFKNIKL